MNRRNFLKRCSLIPFAGSLAAVAKTEASEDKPQLTLAKLMEAKKALDATVDENFLIPVDINLYNDYTGLDEAFCYGGKLFRVYPTNIHGAKQMMLRRETAKVSCYMEDDDYYSEWRNIQCEAMIHALYRDEKSRERSARRRKKALRLISEKV